ncbi:MAG TPA: arylamine N-acetyltransferase [Allosphingosinicella sp.]|nr:arylamine N-acetyltransferase [Allosphingosinicella sp.]
MTLTPAQLDAYFARIGIAPPARADLEGLAAIHRAHALAFTWEAADAFLLRPGAGDVDPRRAFARMVEGRRGGWCYEMNGLLGAALAGFGFRVTRLCGGVRRAEMGEMAVGNHLSLRVDLADGPWLVESGLGDALPRPIPLAVGAHEGGFLACAIETADGDWLRYVNHRWGQASSFDFRADYSDEARLAGMEAFLRTQPGSPFTGALAVMRHFPDRIESLANRTRRTVTAVGVETREITDAADFAETLGGLFALDLPDVPVLWAKTGEAAARGKQAA